MSDWEQSLLSQENLDRSSPELWPEASNARYMKLNRYQKRTSMERRISFPGQRVPGVTEYAARHSISGSSIPNVLEAVRNFDSEDHKLLKYYSSLSKEALIQELKKLHDQAYKLGLEESKEMTRGRFLNILSSTSRKK